MPRDTPGEVPVASTRGGSEAGLAGAFSGITSVRAPAADGLFARATGGGRVRPTGVSRFGGMISVCERLDDGGGTTRASVCVLRRDAVATRGVGGGAAVCLTSSASRSSGACGVC